ncbi:MAG: PAS domain S-box protein [Mucilaginibacter sp.]
MELPYKVRNNIIIIGLIVLICGLFIITGWITNAPPLQKLLAFQIAVKFNTGLCFALFGVSLLASQSENKTFNSLFYVSAALGTTIGLLTFSQELFRFNCGIDTLFIGDKTPVSSILPFPGRMASNSSLDFSLLGIGLLMIKATKRSYRIAAQYLFHLVTTLSAISLIGFLYGVSLFQTLFYITAMPPHTATLFFILSIAASIYNPSLGISQVFTGQLVGNRMARRLFFMLVLVVIFLATLHNGTHEMQLFSSKDIGISLLSVCFLFMSLLLIWNTASWLNKIDIRRQEAESKVTQINAELEKLIEERSAELRETELKFRTIAERSMVGVYIVQGETFVYVNPRFAHVFGYEPAELINVKGLVEKIFHEDQHQMVRENMRLRLAGEVESVHYEVMGKRKDGTKNWVEFYGNAVTIGGEPTIIGSMIDITERKKTEEELKSS